MSHFVSHCCFGPASDPYRAVCLCVRGVDHTEDEHDVPLDATAQVSGGHGGGDNAE